MKLKYIAIFALAFAVCAGWNLLFDALKTAKPAVETAAKLQEEKEPQGNWPSPLRPLEIRSIPTCTSTKPWIIKSRKSPSTWPSAPFQAHAARRRGYGRPPLLTTTAPSTRLASSGPSWSISNRAKPSKAAAPSASRSSRTSSCPRTGRWPARHRNSSWLSYWNITTAKMTYWKSI